MLARECLLAICLGSINYFSLYCQPITTTGNMLEKDNLLDKKWEECAARFIVNVGVGTAVGIAVSALFFKRKFWPIPLAFGFSSGTFIPSCW